MAASTAEAFAESCVPIVKPLWCNAVLLEGMRVVRCHDAPINSVVAAGAASYVLVSSHSAFPPASLAPDACSVTS